MSPSSARRPPSPSSFTWLMATPDPSPTHLATYSSTETAQAVWREVRFHLPGDDQCVQKAKIAGQPASVLFLLGFSLRSDPLVNTSVHLGFHVTWRAERGRDMQVLAVRT